MVYQKVRLLSRTYLLGILSNQKGKKKSVTVFFVKYLVVRGTKAWALTRFCISVLCHKFSSAYMKQEGYKGDEKWEKEYENIMPLKINLLKDFITHLVLPKCPVQVKCQNKLVVLSKANLTNFWGWRLVMDKLHDCGSPYCLLKTCCRFF